MNSQTFFFDLLRWLFSVLRMLRLSFWRPHTLFNPLIAALKQHSNGPSYNNTVIGTLAVTFGTARRGLGGAADRPGPSSLYQM